MTKIALCGARSTGKTTLAKALSIKKSIPYIDEVARSVLASIGSSASHKDAQGEILQELIRKEHENYDKSFIACRSIIDVMAHSLHYPDLREQCLRHLHIAELSYDYLFFVPVVPEVSYEADDVRGSDSDARLREQNDLLTVLFRVMIEHYEVFQGTGGIRFKMLHSVTLDGRVQEIEDYIRSD